MKIPDKEWQQYLKDCHSSYVYCKPQKKDIEQFLTWRENKQEQRSKNNNGKRT